jgi:hypothetical protein
MGKHRGDLRSAFGEKKTLSEWKSDSRCIVCGTTVNRRLRRGWTLERALTAQPNEEDLREAFGERKPLGQWVNDSRCIVAERTVIGRLARGEQLEEALTRPASVPASTRPRTGKKWTAFGESKTINEWGSDSRCAVPMNVLRWRLLKGVLPEMAITKSAAKHERAFEAFGETKSLRGWVKDARCAVTYGTLTQRIDWGWNIVDAISKPPISPGCPRKQQATTQRQHELVLPSGLDVPLEAFGEKKTLREWAVDPRCKVPYLRLRTRLKNGWSLEDAIATIPAVGNRNVEAFGESKSLSAWEKDPRCVVTHNTLRYRMINGDSLEEAMTRPPQNVSIRPSRGRRKRSRRPRSHDR